MSIISERRADGYMRISASKIIDATNKARLDLIGLEARINTPAAGRYNGRLGCITEVIPDGEYGLRALVMVFYKGQNVAIRHGSKSYLNSDSQTRTYWPLEQIILTGRRIYGGV
jgi:hypothetical protein